MANLSIRKIKDEVVEKIRLKAAEDGISMEEEIRQILEKAVSNPQRLGDSALKYFGEKNGIDLEIPQHKPHEPFQF
jgi:plasmid stability protein